MNLEPLLLAMMSSRLFLLGVFLVTVVPMGFSESTFSFQKEASTPSDLSSDSSNTEKTRTKGISPTLIEANPEAGFEYPYYLYVPEDLRDDTTPILVQPNNTAQPSDDFEVHLKEVKNKIERGLGRHISDELGVPLVYPVFPRPVSDPVDWTHLIQQLDLETMKIQDGPLKRVDKQLLRMVADAQERLGRAGYAIDEGIMLNGFSASGMFANRFAALHPEKVISVTAGGINGMPILPYEEVAQNPLKDAETYSLNYHVGTANMEALTGRPFNRSAFRDVPQYLYIGENDNHDALLYPDPFTGTDLRIAALLAYGEDIHNERFPRAKRAYEQLGAKTVFRMYENAGHTPKPAIDDVVEFHERTLAGEDIKDIRADLGGNVPEPPEGPGLRP